MHVIDRVMKSVGLLWNGSWHTTPFLSTKYLHPYTFAMPPKSGSGKEKDLTDEDEVLQAVILADSFNKRFRPLTVGKPRCLLPVCNATLLDWTFESLALAGVQEIFVICRSYAELVKAAIRDSKWSKPSSGIKIVPIITSKETFTPGDAMRDIYTRGLITTDFVLVMGDLVSNVRIDEVVRVHKERRRNNKDAIMTMVVKESGAVHRTRSKGDSAVFVLDPETSECLHYEPITGYPPTKVARIPREVLQEHPEIEVRNDLIDCAIDVCSVEVPSLFQDNFDYGDIRRDFVHGVLTSDLLMKSIHCYVVKEGYAARVADTRSYDAISKDILSRWTFPLVPDDNHPGGHSYEHLRGNKYIPQDNSVVLSRTCKIGPNTLIGSHTQINDNATVLASVIGQRCVIGPNVVLKNAYIFDDAHIGAGTIIEESIIGEGVEIGEGSTIEKGSLVGDGVILGKNAHLGTFERVSKRSLPGDESDEEDDDDDEEEEDSELEEVEANQDKSVVSILGEGSNAIVWPKGPRENDDEIDEVERYDNQRLMRIGDSASDLELESEGETDDESDSESDSDSDIHPLSRTSSATSVSAPSVTPATIHSLQEAAAQHEFQREVKASLERAFAENHSVDNAAVELKTLRMASNVDLRKVREAVVAAIVEKINIVEGDAASQRKEIGLVIRRWGPLIDKIGGIDAVETVEVLQYHCANSPRMALFGQILAALYQDDIVDEDDIRAWHKKPVSKGIDLKEGVFLENVKRCWAIGTRMIQQFDEQESSSEEESGDDDDDADDDDGEDGDEDDEKKPASTAAPSDAKGKDKPESEDDEESSEEESGSGSGEEESEEEEETKPVPKTATPSASVTNRSEESVTPAPTSISSKVDEKSKAGGSASEESEDDSESDADSDATVESSTPAVKESSIPVPAASSTQEKRTSAAPPSSTSKPVASAESSEEETSEDEDDDEEESGPDTRGRSSTITASKPPVVLASNIIAAPDSSSTAPPVSSTSRPSKSPSPASESSEDGSEADDDDDDDEDEDASASEASVEPSKYTAPSTQTAPTIPPSAPPTASTSVSVEKPSTAASASESSEDGSEDEGEEETDEDEDEDGKSDVEAITTPKLPSAPAPVAASSSTSAPPPPTSSSTIPTTKSVDSSEDDGSDEDDDDEEDEDSEDNENEAKIESSTIKPLVPPPTVPTSTSASPSTILTSSTSIVSIPAPPKSSTSTTESSSEEEEEEATTTEDEDEDEEGEEGSGEDLSTPSTKLKVTPLEQGTKGSSSSGVPPPPPPPGVFAPVMTPVDSQSTVRPLHSSSSEEEEEGSEGESSSGSEVKVSMEKERRSGLQSHLSGEESDFSEIGSTGTGTSVVVVSPVVAEFGNKLIATSSTTTKSNTPTIQEPEPAGKSQSIISTSSSSDVTTTMTKSSTGGGGTRSSSSSISFRTIVKYGSWTIKIFRYSKTPNIVFTFKSINNNGGDGDGFIFIGSVIIANSRLGIHFITNHKSRLILASSQSPTNTITTTKTCVATDIRRTFTKISIIPDDEN
ncbi:hypothetical protein C8Q75DRAFT_861962 [Abortiporus biennis]|nr:hypothetical protein C8Q75DRAFT_861962 [Abortiporus biennis]